VVGLIGWGHTARRFAELLEPFGCSILVATESGDPAELDAIGVRRATLGEVLASARVISLHKGLTDATRGFLTEQHLSLIRPGSVLVNIARGELIDERALLARLAKGDITAGLDVYAEEPLARDHPLRKLDNVILTPHHASATAQEELRMGDQAVDMLLAWADGRPVDSLDARRVANMT
jgi:phosphoglycerate dehydrogenase-like enzyme